MKPLLLTLLAAAAAAQSTPATHPQPRTAAQVIAQLEAAIAVTLPNDTVDTIKAGDASTPITGIVTTFSPTLAVLRQAVARHSNLVITHEPTFYNHLDQDTLFHHDPVYLEKKAFIEQHHLVIFRFHDGWHLRQPDGIVAGWVARAGWQTYRRPGEDPHFLLPPTTLAALAAHLQSVFGVHAVRVVGDPSFNVTQVAFSPGAPGEAEHVAELERDDVEVLLAGEAHEWEAVEYVRDAMLEGRHKALILLGHEASEESGMETCAGFLRTLFPGLPIAFVPAGEPFWLPAAPPPAPAKSR